MALARLLCTRVTHDLSGPIGALVAGMELLEAEMDVSGTLAPVADVLALLRESAAAGMVRLRFLRAAYGLVTQTVARDAHGLLVEYLKIVAPHCVLTWQQGGSLSADQQSLLLATCLAALDNLGIQGSMDVAVREDVAGVWHAQVMIRGLRLTCPPIPLSNVRVSKASVSKASVSKASVSKASASPPGESTHPLPHNIWQTLTLLEAMAGDADGFTIKETPEGGLLYEISL